jgi:hypothetical protein
MTKDYAKVIRRKLDKDPELKAAVEKERQAMIDCPSPWELREEVHNTYRKMLVYNADGLCFLESDPVEHERSYVLRERFQRIVDAVNAHEGKG